MKRRELALRLSHLGASVVLALTAFFSLILTLDSFFETCRVSTANQAGELAELYGDNVFLNLLLLALLLSVLFLLYRHSSELKLKRLELVLLGWTLMLGLAFIVSTKLAAPWYTDSYIVTNAAYKAALGDCSALDNYFRRFPFQLGYVFYLELCFRAMFLVAERLPQGYYCLAVQGLNLLWLLLGYHALIALTGYIFHSQRVQKLTAIFLFLCLPAVLTCTFLYGNIPAFSLGFCALWAYAAYIRKRRPHQGLLCALCLGLGAALKLNMLIFFVAIAILWAIELFRSPELRGIIFLGIAALSVLFLSGLAQTMYEKRTGQDFGEGIPMIAWMAMGLDEGYAAPGWYSQEHTVDAFRSTGMDPEATAELAKEAISQRLDELGQEPKEAVAFFTQKFLTQWNEPSCGSLWLNQVNLSYGEKGRVYEFFCGTGAKRSLGILAQYQHIVFLGLSLCCIYMWRRKELFRCLPMVPILGGMLYHLLFEAKSQYALPYFMLMLPLAAFGYCHLFRNIECMHHKEK